jgi:hypothetical protein
MTTTQVLSAELTYAGRTYPAGTPITPLGSPASGGYFFASVEFEGRQYVISIRETDICEAKPEPTYLNGLTPERYEALKAEETDIRYALAADLQRMGLMPDVAAHDEDAHEAERDGKGGPCEWFAMCENPATTVRQTPWGSVPICQRCADKVDALRK